MKRFIKLIRMEDNPHIADLLSSHHNEFILLTVIAMRARRSSDECTLTGLKQNEARIGDYKNYGMSERNYRTAKANLKKWNFATFEATNKGTVATLSNNGVYDINCELVDGQTAEQPTGNRQATDDKEECNNEKKEDKAGNLLTIEIEEFLARFNEASGKRCRVVDDKTRRQFRDRRKEGFTIDDMIKAVINIKADKYHRENNYKYLSLDFVTRGDKLQKWSNAGLENGEFVPFHETDRDWTGAPLCNGLTQQEYAAKFGDGK